MPRLDIYHNTNGTLQFQFSFHSSLGLILS